MVGNGTKKRLMSGKQTKGLPTHNKLSESIFGHLELLILRKNTNYVYIMHVGALKKEDSANTLEASPSKKKMFKRA